MMKWLIATTSIIGALNSASLACRANQSMDTVTAHYFPFDHETFIPITMDSIEERARCKFTLNRLSPEVSMIEKLVETMGRGEFDATVVRLKVSGLLEGDLYVDVDGGILISHPRREGSSEGASFDDLKATFVSLAQKEGCGD